MPRRKIFKSVSNNILESFISRYNDMNGYWALGQYVNLLQKIGEKTLVFDLKNATTIPERDELFETAQVYWKLILHIMKAHKMPNHWLEDAKITFSIGPWCLCYCKLSITSDQNKIYTYQTSVLVRPHDPNREGRRLKADWGLSSRYKFE